MPCVIKYEFDDGIKLRKSKQPLWCGKTRKGSYQWVFSDAQHAALADKPICSCCKANIIKELRNR